MRGLFNFVEILSDFFGSLLGSIGFKSHINVGFY